jgi:hypothetical protein
MYVLQAVRRLNKLQQEEAHVTERPIAYLAYQNAEINRDRKKRRKPFSPSDFYMYQDRDELPLPEARYGAAAMKLIEMDMFPGWALFTFKELKAKADQANPPEVLCLQCEDAIILAPSIEGQHVSGMLIAANTASRKRREMRSPCGNVLHVEMPEIKGKFEADEEVELRIYG